MKKINKINYLKFWFLYAEFILFLTAVPLHAQNLGVNASTPVLIFEDVLVGVTSMF